MDTTKRIFPALPHWVAWLYAGLATITIPWTVYLAVTLPTHQLSHHWDTAWVGLDMAIIGLLLLNAIYAFRESKWLVMSGTATSTLLIVDAWFDVVSAKRGGQFIQALALALIIELPLAYITFRVAMRLVKREHLKNLG